MEQLNANTSRFKLDWRSACLFMVADPQWRRKIWIGGWVLLLPVVGWPIILGYRKEAIVRLVQGASPLLPDWKVGLWHYFKEGMKAIGVINAWFAPAWIWTMARLLTCPESASIPWLAFALFFLVLPIFSTLAIPLLLIYARFGLTSPAISFAEATAISAIFGLAVFLIPAGFLNVSRTGRYLAAFDVFWIARTITKHFVPYLEAWIGAGIIAMIGHPCVPFSPWGVVWAYLAIVYFFNEIPALERGQAGKRNDYLRESWFHDFRGCYWERFQVTRRMLLNDYRKVEEAAADVAQEHCLSAGAFRAISLGPVSVPIR